LSADPHVQFPNASQSYNRYSYVQNNPLKYTDPSGYFLGKLLKGIKKFFKKVFRAVKRLLQNPIVRMVAGIAAAWFAGTAILNSYWATCTASGAVWGNAVAGAVGGFVGGFIGSGGDLKSAFISGLTGGVAGYIGAHITNPVSRVLAHGVNGGVSAVLRGGKFIRGFFSSAFTKWVSDPIQSITQSRPILGGVMAAVVGGTASRIAGGKFANGAMSAGFGYLFNAMGDIRAHMRSSVRSLAVCGRGTCPIPPAAPSGVSVDANIAEAKLHIGEAGWFYDRVRNGSTWDYKQQGSNYEDLGNFNFGATGRAVGFSENILLRGAGWAQGRAGTSDPSWGSWYKSAPYGDDPADQVQIQRGIDYYNCGCDRP
jgi:hypothetical protein